MSAALFALVNIYLSAPGACMQLLTAALAATRRLPAQLRAATRWRAVLTLLIAVGYLLGTGLLALVMAVF